MCVVCKVLKYNFATLKEHVDTFKFRVDLKTTSPLHSSNENCCKSQSGQTKNKTSNDISKICSRLFGAEI